MVKQIRYSSIEVSKVEKGRDELYKFVFYGDKFGELFLELSEEYYEIFKPGKKYVGKIVSSGTPDFLGEEDRVENISTWCDSLEEILYKEKTIWKK